MSHIHATQAQTGRPWTCPFCPLLCDAFDVVEEGPRLRLTGSECPRAHAALQHFEAGVPTPSIDGQPASLDAAIAAAASRLGSSRQPLFAGLGTDVAGARALYALACETGAICDAGPGLMQGLRALQDRGGFTTTLAEVRNRADMIVCIGGLPSDKHPEFFQRCLPSGAAEPPQVVVLADAAPGAFERVPLAGDLFETVAALARLVAGRGDAASPLAGLAARLQAARYAVLVYESARLRAHGALIIELLQRIVATLNRSTRAAALPLGGGEGASTVNQVFTWLSGLPLRSRAGPLGLEHEPLCFDAQRLLDEGSVDLLLWVSSFTPQPAPQAPKLPRIVLGHPALAQAGGDVFIPVATPGIGSAGHLFRTDSSVLMPLRAVRDDGLPAVADVVQRIVQAVREQRGMETAA